MNWMQVEEYLRHDDRAVLPLGSTEQHSHLRLTVDCILPERVAADAAEPLGVPVFPVVPYGVTPYFREFPGSISLRVETHLRVVGDILDGMAHSGFRRILIVNGHGGNNAVQQFALEWAADHPAAACSSTTGGTRRARGPRCRRSIRWRRTARGWRTSRGRACPA